MAFTTTTYGPLAGSPPSAYALGSPIDVAGAYVLPPTGRIFFVRGNGTTVSNVDDQYTAQSTKTQQCFPSVKSILDAGLCKASRGDTIVCLPGHTENISAADCWAFVAGLKIIGIGYGATRPTFTFSVAAATLLVDVAGVSIQNCRFLCAGPAGTTALTVVKGFVISGEGALFVDNYIEVGVDADQLCTTPITVTGANCAFYGNRIKALAAAAPITGNCILLGAAGAGADGFTFVGNYVKAATSGVAVGLIANINSTATSTDIVIAGNFLHNWLAVSTTVISMAGNMVTTGVVRENTFKVELNSSVQGVVYSGTGVDLALDNNRIVNVANETALQNQGTASA